MLLNSTVVQLNHKYHIYILGLPFSMLKRRVQLGKVQRIKGCIERIKGVLKVRKIPLLGITE